MCGTQRGGGFAVHWVWCWWGRGGVDRGSKAIVVIVVAHQIVAPGFAACAIDSPTKSYSGGLWIGSGHAVQGPDCWRAVRGCVYDGLVLECRR